MQCKADKEKYSKKVQRRHVALQELLKQFLLVYHYNTCVFPSTKKSARSAPCYMYHYNTSGFLSTKKVQSKKE